MPMPMTKAAAAQQPMPAVRLHPQAQSDFARAALRIQVCVVLVL